MKQLFITALITCLPFAAQAKGKTTISGTALFTADCAEAKLEIAPRSGLAECLGFDGVAKSDIVPGRAYWLEGYRSADGFFATKVLSDQTTWEVKQEIPVGQPCPSQARAGDEIAYQVNGNGGYVCYACGLKNSATPVVTEQTMCNRRIQCDHGTCE